ncbi:MAG: PQQ-binding-like beta-propeller repeat protein [Thermoanaerobaculia bacterium]|nr:PQQ-binding-like beta-propeller repeat protein [Thermoanaerobaculia bacterium]
MKNRQRTFTRAPALTILLLFAGISSADEQKPTEPRTVSWQFEAGGKVIAKPTVVGPTIYLAGGNTVHALDLQGEERWQRELPGTIAARIDIDGADLYVHSSEGLYALDEEGKRLWSYEHEDRGPLVDGRTWGWGDEILPDPWGWYRSAPMVDGETVYFGSSDGVLAVHRATGERRWAVPVGPVTADPVSFQDLLVIACWNHSVYGLEKESGKVRWRFRASMPPSKGVDWIGYAGFHLSPEIDGDRIFVGNRNTYFYALNAKDGTEAWSSKVGASWMGSPAVLTEDAVYYGLSDGMAVLGHRKDTGALRFLFRTGSLVFAQPEVHGNRLIVGTISGHLYIVDTMTGQGELLLHLGPEEKRYAEFFDPEIVPKDLTRHRSTSWSIEKMLTESNSILNLTVHDDTAYVGTASGVLYAVPLGPAS